ncbi:MAG TPA: glycoside hydrolase family 15 protein [Streptosporangiaceae bacterium]|nr:glycoside hydrolase family 15 protein [Streptosporangiaceae bacterium]
MPAADRLAERLRRHPGQVGRGIPARPGRHHGPCGPAGTCRGRWCWRRAGPPRGERNWDYRYCWLRDSACTLWSLYALGFDWEADDFFWFLADLAQRDGELQVVYGVDGERELTERVLDHLSGYDGAAGAGRQRGLHAAPA